MAQNDTAMDSRKSMKYRGSSIKVDIDQYRYTSINTYDVQYVSV